MRQAKQPQTLTEYRAAFGRCEDGDHKQIGLRRIREITQLHQMRDAEAHRTADMFERGLPYHLAHAQAAAPAATA